jgi:hypothetical protein
MDAYFIGLLKTSLFKQVMPPELALVVRASMVNHLKVNFIPDYVLSRGVWLHLHMKIVSMTVSFSLL